jgi:hypothetical protein
MINARTALKYTAPILAVGFLGVGPVSCSPPSLPISAEEAVVGKWREVVALTNTTALSPAATTKSAPATFEFRHNGQLITRGQFSPEFVIPGLGDRPLTNRYSFMDEQKIRILFGRGRKEEYTAVMQASFSGNRLILTEASSLGLTLTNSSLRAKTNALLRTNAFALARTNAVVPAKTNSPGLNWGGVRGVLTLERIE